MRECVQVRLRKGERERKLAERSWSRRSALVTRPSYLLLYTEQSWMFTRQYTRELNEISYGQRVHHLTLIAVCRIWYPTTKRHTNTSAAHRITHSAGLGKQTSLPKPWLLWSSSSLPLLNKQIWLKTHNGIIHSIQHGWKIVGDYPISITTKQQQCRWSP